MCKINYMKSINHQRIFTASIYKANFSEGIPPFTSNIDTFLFFVPFYFCQKQSENMKDFRQRSTLYCLLVGASVTDLTNFQT